MTRTNFGNMLEKVFDTNSALYQSLLYYIMCRKGVYYNKVSGEYNNSYDDYCDELAFYEGDKNLFNFDIDIRGNESIMYDDYIMYDCTIGQVNFIDWLHTTGILEHVYGIRVELVEELIEEGLLRGTPKILYELNNKITNSINTLKMNSEEDIIDSATVVEDANDVDVNADVDEDIDDGITADNISLGDMVEVDITYSTTNSVTCEENVCEAESSVDADFTDEDKDKLIDSLELEDAEDMHIGAAYDGDEGDCEDGDENCDFSRIGDEYVDGEDDEINYEFNKMINEKMSRKNGGDDETDETNFNEAEFMSVLNETLQKIQEKYGAEQSLSDDTSEPNPDKMNDIMKIFMDVLMNRNQSDASASTATNETQPPTTTE